ncbi:TIGR02611 family protein [Jatrophihabitans sp.]|uniref:TIGR02611 family protein n=1 Tax=Jatrophihabitans sp. TaxID=1932789 RepID=UPI0030C736E1|nr:hypothetical protein [Jatrophihabitans sp.]
MTTPPRVSRLGGVRERARSTPFGRIAWRVGVTILGALVIAIGIVLLPLPGPGWVIIFGGLGILATEYPWAARLLRQLRDLVKRWGEWLRSKGLAVQILAGILSVAFLAAIIYGCYLLYRALGT